MNKSGIYVDIARLQWTRKERIAHGEDIKERCVAVGLGEGKIHIGSQSGERLEETGERRRMRNISMGAFGVLCFWILGSWVAYFWGAATGNND